MSDRGVDDYLCLGLAGKAGNLSLLSSPGLGTPLFLWVFSSRKREARQLVGQGCEVKPLENASLADGEKTDVAQRTHKGGTVHYVH